MGHPRARLPGESEPAPELTSDQYERVRSRATVFVVVPGHERPEIERVVEANEGFVLVEKVAAVEEIVEADPRSDDPGAV